MIRFYGDEKEYPNIKCEIDYKQCVVKLIGDIPDSYQNGFEYEHEENGLLVIDKFDLYTKVFDKGKDYVILSLPNKVSKNDITLEDLALAIEELAALVAQK